MLKQERLDYILEEIRTFNKVKSSSLSEKLNVSEDTIRRDLKELSVKGKIKKVHGGAMSSSYIPFSHKDREIYAHKEKVSIVRKARELITDDHIVVMDGGTTNLELARLLPSDLKATILTNSLPIAIQLTDHPNIDLFFFGGKILKSAQVAVGFDVIQNLADVQADLCIIGTRSIHYDRGITDIDREEAQVKQALINSATQVVSLAISEKLDTVQPFKVVDINKVHTIVTELEPTDSRLLHYKNQGIEVL